MVTYIRNGISFSEICGLSKDKKPGRENGVQNGSVFKELDSGKEFRYNAETSEWIEQGKPYPVSLSVKDGKYTAVLSDGTELANVKVDVLGSVAAYIENGVSVTCTVPKSSRKK